MIGGQSMESEIARLVTLMKKRKPEALEKVMELFMDSVYTVAKHILYNIGSEEDIEECVQDVFISAWDNINKFDPERGTLKTWLLILCKYRALNIRKMLTDKGKIIVLEEKLISSDDNVEKLYLGKESKAEVIAAINSFNTTDREVFLRRYILEQSIEDICNIMNLSRQAVDNRLWRGRKQLKEILNQFERRSINE
jgi:RNA polymerase sigma-70 factor (ECF subfamily)